MGHRRDVPLGQLGVQQVQTDGAVSPGDQGVLAAGEYPVEPIAKKRETRHASPGGIVARSLGVVLGYSIGGRYVRPTNGAEDACFPEGRHHLLLFAHDLEDTP